MPSVGVVLGAGGIVGAAYHAGVLTALAEAGFDARDADLIVGTSAGSAVGATLRAGFPPLDLAPRNLGEPISDAAASIVGSTGGPPTLDLRPRPFTRPPLPSSPKLLFRSARHPTKALAGLLPTGTIATDVIGERISLMYGDRSWPEHPLWICAVDLEHGDRVVFGRDDARHPGRRRSRRCGPGVVVDPRVLPAGRARPPALCRRRSAFADQCRSWWRDEKFDIVVIVSPMSATRPGHGALGSPTRARSTPVDSPTRSSSLRRAGTHVLTFQPTPEVIAAMGRNSMDAARRVATTTSALASARERLADPHVADRLQLLRSASQTSRFEHP